MSIPGAGNPLLLGGAGGYKIERSLRFNSSDSAYCSRVFSSSGSSTWTFSCWAKIGTIESNYKKLFGLNENNGIFIYDNRINLNDNTNNDVTVAYYRDPSAWYHIVVRSNGTTNAVWVNSVQQTLATSSCTAGLGINSAAEHRIGKQDSGSAGVRNGFNGYLADVHFIDGQALDPSSFGQFDANNVWQPKAYSGTYGTNGFKLAFADNSAATATTLGKDTSGNGNNWTPNNLSVTAGAGNDSLVDSPTNYGTDTGAGGEVRGNYATLNPLASYPTGPMANGNLEYGGTNVGGYQSSLSTVFATSGKYYAEFTLISGTVADCLVGVGSPSFPYSSATGSSYVGYTNNSYGYLAVNGNTYNGGSATAYGNSYTTNDVIGIALDIDNGKVWFRKNGTWQASGNPETGLNAAYSSLTGQLGFICSAYSTGKWSANFGQRPFAYTAPSGFKALCTQNLPAPTITKPSTVMDVALWTGNGSARSITGLGFNPDLVWIKGRSGATDHALYDSVRGAEKRLESNTTDAEVTSDGGVTTFNSDGFSLGTLAQVNTNSATYAGWIWDAGSSTVTNTQGSITSQVRANASAGFSVVSYDLQATGSKTVGHGLGVAPSLIIAIPRNIAHNTFVYHASVGATAFLYLNTTTAASANSTVWDNTAPTSSVFTLGSGWTSGTYGTAQVAYCFAPVAGYSSFGRYTGNGSTDGPFVYTGFRPRWIMVKRTDATSNWTIIDTAREGYNVDNDPLYPNTSDAEGTADLADILSNGFKLRSTDASVCANAGTYIYAAFAESPFSLARAR